MAIIRLPLDGAKNVRDIGGYVGEDKKVGRFNVFVRASNLNKLTIADNEYLKRYGITDIIDLRGEDEIFLEKDSIDYKYFHYYTVPLLTKKFNDNLMYEKGNFDMGVGYTILLENKEAIKEIFEILASSEGGCLYHCTAGKDRTGIVTMLILGLCGVSIQDIIANYEVTYTYMPYVINDNKDFNPKLALSLPEYIKEAINYILNNYGSFYDYLISCNIDKESLEIIKNKYLE